MKTDKKTLAKRQLAGLDSLSLNELKNKFSELFGFEFLERAVLSGADLSGSKTSSRNCSDLNAERPMSVICENALHTVCRKSASAD